MLLIANRKIRDDHQAAQKCGFEDLVQFRLEGLHQAFRTRHGLRIGAELRHGVGAGIRGQNDDGVLEVDLAAFAVFHLSFVEHLVEELHARPGCAFSTSSSSTTE